MGTITNISKESFFVPAVGRVLEPGESAEVAVTAPFANHPFLRVGTTKPEPPAPQAEEPAPVPASPAPASAISQAAPEAD